MRITIRALRSSASPPRPRCGSDRRTRRPAPVPECRVDTAYVNHRLTPTPPSPMLGSMYTRPTLISRANPRRGSATPRSAIRSNNLSIYLRPTSIYNFVQRPRAGL